MAKGKKGTKGGAAWARTRRGRRIAAAKLRRSLEAQAAGKRAAAESKAGRKRLSQLFDEEWLNLSQEDWTTLLRMLDNPRPPNEVAKAARELYLTIPHLN